MTRNTFFATMMFAFMAMFSLNSNAQHRGGYGMSHPGGGREMHMNNGGGYSMHHDGGRHHGNMGHRDMVAHHGGPRYEMHHGHRWDDRGYLHGWDGRVRRFHDGRWGYLRDGAWYYYDCFYEPDFYYAHPLSHFHAHLFDSPRARRIVGATAGAVAVAALVSTLMR